MHKISQARLRSKIANSFPENVYGVLVEKRTEHTATRNSCFVTDLTRGQHLDMATGRDWTNVLGYATELLERGHNLRVFLASTCSTSTTQPFDSYVDIDPEDVVVRSREKAVA